MLRATVPETSVDEDGDFPVWEYDVDRHPLNPLMEPEPEPGSVKL